MHQPIKCRCADAQLPIALDSRDFSLLPIGCSVKFDGSCPVWRTVELTEQGSFLLCGWNADHTHMVISEVGAETEECVRRMTEELSFPIMIDIKSFKL